MKKLTRLTNTLLGLSLLVGCAPQMPAGVAPLNRASVGTFSTPRTGLLSGQLLMTDSFGKWQRAEEAQEGFNAEVPAVPVEGKTVAQLPAATGAKTLTYLTYEALDNNLYADLNRVVDTLELVGSNAQMNMLAQTDNFGPGNAARYYLQQDKFGAITSPNVKIGDAGENSGDPNTLANAVRWGFNAYPARVNWLNMSSHGMGFAGVGYDDSPQQSNMDILSFHQALKGGLNGKKLDIITFDACLMSAVEVASELQDTANIIVGSEDSTFYWGFGYYTTFSRIAQNPTAMNPDQVARSLVVDVNNKGASDQTLTIAATDLRKIGLLEQSLDQLARALRQAMPTQKANIIRAMQLTKDFHQAENIPFRDINRMISLLKQNVNDPTIAKLCDDINHVLYQRGVIMFSRQSKQENDQGRGLSIYLPTDGKVAALYGKTRFAQTTQWDEFLQDLNQAINQAAGI